MNSSEALKYLKERDRYITNLGYIYGVLSWDFETVMPEGAAEGRIEQFSILSELMHNASLDPKLKEAVYTVEDENISDSDKALLREWKKNIENNEKTPLSLVKALSEEEGRAHSLWVEAREKDDFSIFKTSLEKLVQLRKEYASCIGDGTYDTLLDLYEKGMTREKVDNLFNPLEKSICSLMDRLGDVKVDNSFLYCDYDVSSLEEFCNSVMFKMGFDKKRGTTGIVAHPFTTNLGPDDIRVSNRFTDDSFVDPIFTIVHETGHALYEMYASLNSDIRATSLSNGVSMGFHESQSRFWENIMGRSKPFWEYFYPQLQHSIPSLKSHSLDEFLLAINRPSPSAIRVNADELTYSLHIILRYRIEKGLFDNSISVSDVPHVWSELSEKLIGYKVKSNREGCLQDSHWSSGSFGYFPTYALGNLYSAMFMNQLYKDKGGKDKVDNALREGNLSFITEWQDKNIWHYGSIYEPNTLLQRICGEELSSSYFIKYLEEKFTSLYL